MRRLNMDDILAEKGICHYTITLLQVWLCCYFELLASSAYMI
jgi:hypothetical protein